MEITFLGTGSSIPTEKKNHPGILIQFNSENILVDCGEGIQRQLRIAKLNPCKLTKLLITHWHADHTLGIPGLLETLAMSEYQKTLEIYGPVGTKEKIALFEKIYGKFKIKTIIKEVKGIFLNTPDFVFEASQMSHGVATNAYSITIKDKLRIDKDKLKKLKIPNSPIIKKLQEGKDIIHPTTKKLIKAKPLLYLQKGKKISIVLDTKINENAVKISKNADLLISEASFTEEHKSKAEDYNHLTAEQAATIAKKAKAKSLFLVHNSQRYENNEGIILKEAKKVFKNTKVPNDFDKTTI